MTGMGEINNGLAQVKKSSYVLNIGSFWSRDKFLTIAAIDRCW